MLEELGIKLVMIGHSERGSHVFGESDIEENRKSKICLRHEQFVLCYVLEKQQKKRNTGSVGRFCANS